MKIKTYNGLLCLHNDGEASDILYLHNIETPLAEELEYLRGKQVTVRYFTSDVKKIKEELEEDLIKKLFGVGEISYHHAYSDYTGYLWTTEKLKIGGHDLLKELHSHVGKWLYLEIEL